MILAPLAEGNKDDKTQCKDVVHLIFRGEEVSLSLVDAHRVLCLPPEELCRGLVFNDYAPYSISIEVNGRKIQPVYKDINLSRKEFVAPKEWQTTKKLDWNRCVNKWQDVKFCCSIEVDGKFDEKMLRYNIVYPVSVRVGGKSYRYNRPILTSVDYKGANYSLVPYIRHTINDWTLDGFEIPDIRNIRLKTVIVKTDIKDNHMNSRYERSTDVLYRLTAIYYENKRYARYPRFKVWKHTYGYFHTLEEAEELMRKQVDKRKSFAEDDIGYHYYGFIIDEIPFGQKLGSIYDSYCTRTYLEDGTFFASTKVSNIQSTDMSYYYCRGFEPFKGRSEDECNFKAGDLVEVFDGDTVSLQIVYSLPPTPERAEQIYQNVRNDLLRRGKAITDDELCWMLDYSDDSYVTLDGDEGYMENHLHWYATELFPVRRRVSDKLREKLERGYAKVQNELKH